MPETATAVLDLIKPEIGGSKQSWGNRTNENWDKLEAFVKAHHELLSSSIQNGGQTASFSDYNAAGDPITPARNLNDESFRVMKAPLYYVDTLLDDPFHDIPRDRPGAVVYQKWVKALLDECIPVGTIFAYTGPVASIPKGWQLCDGSSYVDPANQARNTPNLFRRNLIGGYSYGVGGTTPFAQGDFGGEVNHIHGFTTDKTALTQGHLPHVRLRFTDNAGHYTSSAVTYVGDTAQADKGIQLISTLRYNDWQLEFLDGRISAPSADEQGHYHTGKTYSQSTTAGVAVELFPLYYVVAYIMKVKRLQDMLDKDYL